MKTKSSAPIASFAVALAGTGLVVALADVSKPRPLPPDQAAAARATAATAGPAAAAANTATEPSVARGRHLIQVAGCNDCHTDGFMENPAVAESEWLTGSALGWYGPWGTTYPPNLRWALAPYEDAQVWIQMVRARAGLPPMPWPSLHAMSDDELRSVHAYIRSLPVTGDVMPGPLPPGQTPQTPYFSMFPVVPE